MFLYPYSILAICSASASLFNIALIFSSVRTSENATKGGNPRSLSIWSFPHGVGWEVSPLRGSSGVLHSNFFRHSIHLAGSWKGRVSWAGWRVDWGQWCFLSVWVKISTSIYLYIYIFIIINHFSIDVYRYTTCICIWIWHAVHRYVSKTCTLIASLLSKNNITPLMEGF